MSFIAALLLAVVASMPGGGPPLDLPANWVQSWTPGSVGSIRWLRSGTPSADYPVSVSYSYSTEAYSSLAPRMSKMLTCEAKDPMVAEMMHISGVCAIVDREEQCEGHPSHRFIHTPLLGHDERIAKTMLLVPWGTGTLTVEYDRPMSEMSLDPRGYEKPDPVLDAMRKWCEAAAASSPQPGPTASGN